MDLKISSAKKSNRLNQNWLGSIHVAKYASFWVPDNGKKWV